MSVSGFVFRTLMFALLWWILTEGDLNSWLVGAPVVVMAALASAALLPPVSWSLSGIVLFIPFFLLRSLYGGVDVAMRALHPQVPISPGVFEHRWRLPPGLPRVFMADTVSLLPGTLSTGLDDEHLRVHVLDQSGDYISELSVVEEKVARLFGLNLHTDKRGE